MKKYWVFMNHVDAEAREFAAFWGSEQVEDARWKSRYLTDLTGRDVRLFDQGRMSWDIGGGRPPALYYDGERLDGLPDAFLTIFPASNLFVLEHTLLRLGVDSLIDFTAYHESEKAQTYQILAENGVRIPQTFVFYSRADRAVLLEKFRFPFVIKPTGDKGGNGVELVHNQAEFDRYMDALEEGSAYVAQEFIATSMGKDLRLVFLDGKLLFAISRQAADPNEFRSNYAQGGKAALVKDVSPDIQDKYGKIARLFQFPLVGLDLMYGDTADDFVVAEVNSLPGLPDSETLGKIVQFLIERYEAETERN